MEIPPIEKLSVKDGQLLQDIGSAAAKNTVPFMDTPEISIVGKGEPKPNSQPVGFWTFPFELNERPDPIWIQLFRRCVPLNLDAAPQVENKMLVLQCYAGNLNARYDLIKSAISQTNAVYKTEKKTLIVRVEQDMIRRDREAKQRAQAEDEIKKAFDQLEL